MAVACQPSSKPNQWNYQRTIDIGEVTPIGLVANKDYIWLSDGDHNQLVQINWKGKVLKTIPNLERPMHIAQVKDAIYVPEYGADTIRIIEQEGQTYVPLTASLDAPAGVDIQGEKVAIADFYNHQVVIETGGKHQIIGSKGKEDGQFHYPTDVQFVGEQLYVADAYNHRIQVFDLEGKHLQTIGQDDKMNATTGIFVTNTQIIATDFEHNRVLLYDKATGSLSQIIDQHLDKPTDVAVFENKLLVTNYKGKSIAIFELN